MFFLDERLSLTMVLHGQQPEISKSESMPRCVPIYGRVSGCTNCVINGIFGILNQIVAYLCKWPYWCLEWLTVQWRIQDFPQGGAWTSWGDVDSRGGYVLKMLYVKTKESRPLGGRVPGTPPSRSANENDWQLSDICWHLQGWIV